MRNCIGQRGHGVERRTLVGRHRQELELVHRSRALAVAGAEAIGAGVAAADDDHVLAGGEDRLRPGTRIALVAPVLLRQELHREMNALQLAAGDVQIARLLGAAREQDGVEVAPQVVDRRR